MDGVEVVGTISMIGDGGRPSFLIPLPRNNEEASEDNLPDGPFEPFLSSVPVGEGIESYVTSSSAPRRFSFSRKFELFDKGFSFDILDRELSFFLLSHC